MIKTKKNGAARRAVPPQASLSSGSARGVRTLTPPRAARVLAMMIAGLSGACSSAEGHGGQAAATEPPAFGDPSLPVGSGSRPPASPRGADVDFPTPDQCRARSLQWLVGRPRASIPQLSAVAAIRITCTTCPVTEDYSPQRLNIFFDARTQIIREVRCG